MMRYRLGPCSFAVSLGSTKWHQLYILPHKPDSSVSAKTKLEHLEDLGLRRAVHGPIYSGPKQQDEEGINGNGATDATAGSIIVRS